MLTIKRILAYLIDLLTTLSLLLLIAFTFQISIFELNLLHAYLMIICTLASIFFLLIYLPTIKQGQTLGKMCLNIKTIRQDHTPLTFFDNFVREVVFKYSLAIVFIPYAIVLKLYQLFSPFPKHTYWLHDTICQTTVTYL
ncbi:MAG: RDD family protein [Erysipelotrichaceae bacterium]|nr:RDD family protein [Erysipelotrichaceae bacterium]